MDLGLLQPAILGVVEVDSHAGCTLLKDMKGAGSACTLQSTNSFCRTERHKQDNAWCMREMAVFILGPRSGKSKERKEYRLGETCQQLEFNVWSLILPGTLQTLYHLSCSPAKSSSSHTPLGSPRDPTAVAKSPRIASIP